MQDNKGFSGIIECTKNLVDDDYTSLLKDTHYYVKPSGSPEWYYVSENPNIKWFTRRRKFLRNAWDAGCIKIIKDER
jgi:hypothetical protein